MYLSTLDNAYRIPELDLGMSEFLVKSYKGSKNGSQIVHDPSVDMNAATYCSFVDSMGIECLEKSILELWNFKDRKIKNLTKDEIINKLNRYIQKYLDTGFHTHFLKSSFILAPYFVRSKITKIYWEG